MHRSTLTTHIWLSAYPQDFRVCARGRSVPKGPSIDSSRGGSCELPPELAGYFSLTKNWVCVRGRSLWPSHGSNPPWVTPCCPPEILPHLGMRTRVSEKLEMSLGNRHNRLRPGPCLAGLGSRNAATAGGAQRAQTGPQTDNISTLA